MIILSKILSIYEIITLVFLLLPLTILPILIFFKVTEDICLKDFLIEFYKIEFYIWLYICVFIIPLGMFIAYITNII